MTKQLTAHAIDAGTLPADFIVRRDDGPRVFEHSKGGWIELMWEEWVNPLNHDQGTRTKVRRIAVSRARALQAFAGLATYSETV